MIKIKEVELARHMLQRSRRELGRGRHAMDVPAWRALRRQLVQRTRRLGPIQESASSVEGRK